LTSLTEILNTW